MTDASNWKTIQGVDLKNTGKLIEKLEEDGYVRKVSEDSFVIDRCPVVPTHEVFIHKLTHENGSVVILYQCGKCGRTYFKGVEF